MSADPWGLPGPGALLDDICADLDAGVVACVEIPVTVESLDLEMRVGARFPGHYLRRMTASDVSGPLGQICDALGVGGGQAVATPQTLIASPEIGGVALWVDGLADLNAGARSSWVSLLDQMAAAADDCGLVVPIVMCVQGDTPALELPDSPRVRARRWWDVLGRLDVAVLVASVDTGIDPVAREEIVALAAGDYALAERLALTPNGAGNEWVELCRARAAELGITGREVALPSGRPALQTYRSDWMSGTISVVDGELEIHSGVLVHADRTREVERRRWASQVRSVLPRMDLLRMALIDLAIARGAMAGWRGSEDGPEVEFKDVSRALSRHGGLARQAALADWLHRSRNDLAHLRCLPATRIAEGKRLASRAGLDWR